MEELALEPQDAAPPAVGIISQHGMAAMGQVDANLVGAARLQACFQEGVRSQFLQHAVGRAGWPAPRNYCHPLAVAGMPADGRVNNPLSLRHMAVHQGQVGLEHRALLLLGHQGSVGGVASGHHDQAGGEAVQAVDDARPERPAYRQVGVAGQKGVDQGAVGMSGGRVNHQAGRLIQHHHVGILVDDGERHLLGAEFRRLRRRDDDLQPVAGAQAVAGADRPAVDRNQAQGDQTLDTGTREVRDTPGDHLVHPPAGLLLAGEKGQFAGGSFLGHGFSFRNP